MKIEINKKAEKALKNVMKSIDCSYSTAILVIKEIAKTKLGDKKRWIIYNQLNIIWN